MHLIDQKKIHQVMNNFKIMIISIEETNHDGYIREINSPLFRQRAKNKTKSNLFCLLL